MSNEGHSGGMRETVEACHAAGLKVTGLQPYDKRTGVIVDAPFTSAKLDRLDEALFRTVPTGSDHTIVVPR